VYLEKRIGIGKGERPEQTSLKTHDGFLEKEFEMGERGNGDGAKRGSSGISSMDRGRNGRGDRRSEMKVQLTYAMNQIARDAEQAIELYAREDVAVIIGSE
jgi:hypothetical protein